MNTARLPETPEPPASHGIGKGWTLIKTWAQILGGGCHLDRHTLDTLEAAFDSVTVLGVKDSPLVPVVYGTARKRQ